MSGPTEDIERLIVRSLDGALTPEEEHELNRELIRDPEARRLSDDYRAIDRLTGSALQAVRAGRGTDFDAVFAAPGQALRRPRGSSWNFHRGWLMVPGAIAAAILATMIPQAGFSPKTRPGIASTGDSLAPLVKSPGRGLGWEQGVIRPVSTVPRTRSDTGREVIGVIGEDGNLYWIEVERTRTIRVPASRDVGRSAADSM